MAIERGDGIRKPRTVHVGGQAPVGRDLAQGAYFPGGVHGAGLGALGHAQCGRHIAVHAMALGGTNRLLESIGLQLAVGPIDRHQAQAIAKKLGGPALIAENMGTAVAEHRSPGRRYAGQRNGIGHGSGCDGQHPGVRLEQPGKRIVEALGPPVLGIGPG